MNENRSPIPSRLYNAAKGGHVAGAADIIDDVKGKTQDVINEEVDESISNLDGKVATEKQRAEGVEGGLNTRLQTVEQLAEISVGGGDIGIGTAADFESDDPEDLAKVPTISAMLGGANDGVYDISARHSGTKYADLAAALGTNGANVPVGVRKGGMSVKFVQSSDNNYIQARLMSNSFTTNIAKWQVIEDTPTAGSKNLVDSNGIAVNEGMLMGIKKTVGITGNGTTAVYPSKSQRVVLLRGGFSHKVVVKANKEIVIPEGLQSGSYAFEIQVKALNKTTNIWTGGIKRAPEHINAEDEIIVPDLNQDGYLSFDGYWPADTTIYLEVREIFEVNYNVYSAGTLIVDNAEHNVIVPSFKLKKGNDAAVTVNEKTIPFSQMPTTATSDWIIYLDKSNNVAAVKGWSNVLSNDVILGYVKYDSTTHIGSVTSPVFNVKLSDIDFTFNIYSTGTLVADNLNKVLNIPSLLYKVDENDIVTVPANTIAYSNIPATTTNQWVIILDKDNNTSAVKRWNQVTSLDIILGCVILDQLEHIGNVTSNVFSTNISDYKVDVIHRNAHKEPAIISGGKKSVSSDLKPFAFMHISDIHTKQNGNGGKGYQCLINARTLMETYTHLKCCIITGDIVYDTFADTMEWYNLALNGTDRLFLNVVGNHDAGQANADVPGGYWASVGTDQQVYNKFIKDYVSQWGVVQPQDAEQDGKSYYYKDFTEEKVRIIVLYEFETDFEKNQEETALKYYREACTVRQAQVDWLIDTLENTPEGYGVIVAHHIPYHFDNSDNPFTTPRLRNAIMDGNYQYQSDPEWLEEILTAYQNKTSINITWNQTGGVVTSLSAQHDFSNAEGEFICILAGHTHDDFIGHPANFPNIVLLTVGADNLHYTGRSCPRAYNQVSEDLVNLVNVDRNRKTITVVRVGSDFSVTGQKRDSITLSYAVSQ